MGNFEIGSPNHVAWLEKVAKNYEEHGKTADAERLRKFLNGEKTDMFGGKKLSEFTETLQAEQKRAEQKRAEREKAVDSAIAIILNGLYNGDHATFERIKRSISGINSDIVKGKISQARKKIKPNENWHGTVR